MSALIRRAVRWCFRLVGLGLWALLVASCATVGESTAGLLPEDALIVTGGTVIDGTGADPIIDGLVAFDDGRVLAVGRAADYSFSSDARVVDVDGGTILPGFIDAHQHETADPAIRRSFLEGGVTSVCSMGSTLADMPLYEEEYSGERLAARGFQSGPIMTAPGGLPDLALHIGYNYEVGTPEEARAGVPDLIERGADVIKVYVYSSAWNSQTIPALDQERLEAIVEEAHSRGVLVRAHITDVSVLEIALDAGIDVVDHLPWINPTEEEVAHALESGDLIQELKDAVTASGLETLLNSMVKTDTVMIPTLERVISAKFSDDQLGSALAELYLDPVRHFHQAGGIIALGTDFNVNIGMTRGIPIAELQRLLDVGLSPMEVIEAATHHAAYACGQQDEIGTLEPGKLGDLIVIPGDPLQNIEELGQISLVVKDGTIAYQPTPS